MNKQYLSKAFYNSKELENNIIVFDDKENIDLNKTTKNQRRFEFNVDTMEFKGDFPENDEDIMWRYGPGDTIDITYNIEDTGSSVTTYSQYWYINPEKEKYWLTVRAGAGMRGTRLCL